MLEKRQIGGGVTAGRLLLAGSLVLLLLPFSCTRRQPDSLTRLRVWVTLDSPEQVVTLKRLVRQFERSHPAYQVAVESVPANRRAEKYLAAMQAGSCADVIYLHWREVPTFAAKRTLVPLDHRIARDRYDVDDFLASPLEAHRFRGRQVSLPDKGATMLLFYNKTLFDRARLPYPTPDWTFADFVTAARRLTRRDAQGRSLQVGCLPYDATSWIWSMGGSLASDDLTRLGFTDPPTVAAVEFLDHLRNRWQVTTRNMNARGQDPAAVDVFESGRVAMAVTGPWELPKYVGIRNFDWDVTLFPRGPAGRQTRYAGMGYGIWSGTAHPEESWELLKFLVGREAMTALRGRGFIDMPTRRSVLAGVFAKQQAPFNLQAMLQSMDPGVSRVRVLPQDERWAAIDRIFFEELDAALLGLKSPRQAMQAARSRAEQYLATTDYHPGPLDYAGLAGLAALALLALRRRRSEALPTPPGADAPPV